MPVLRLLLVAVVLIAASCAGDDDDGDDAATAPPARAPAPPSDDDDGPGDDGPGGDGPGGDGDASPLAEVTLALELVGEFDQPIVWATHPDGTSVVGEKDGRVRDADTGDVVLDLTGVVTDQASEQGLLGLAFPGGGDHLYVSYSDRATNGDSVIAEYPWPPVGADDGRELLRVEQPFANHNGGDIHVGPDGLLYIGLGDGGSAGDPQGHGQDTTTLLGAILRIDPTSPADGRPYAIPADNPLVGEPTGEEIYLYGVRNPWRFSFDAATGDLWVADVGQDAWEEITFLAAADGAGLGANLGWSAMEGSHLFDGPEPADHVGPIYEYPNPDDGCSITGGHVYRGEAIPALAGAYLFADYCRTEIQAVRERGGGISDHAVFALEVPRPVSFGVDRDGELVVLSQDGPVYRISER